MARAEGICSLLLKHKLRICRELDVTDVLPKLVQKRVFNFNEERQILSRNDPTWRAQAFVDLLLHKSPDAVDEFSRCLEQTPSCQHLAGLLRQPDRASPPPSPPGRPRSLTSPGAHGPPTRPPHDARHSSMTTPAWPQRYDMKGHDVVTAGSTTAMDTTSRSQNSSNSLNRDLDRNHISPYSAHTMPDLQPPMSHSQHSNSAQQHSNSAHSQNSYLKPWEIPTSSPSATLNKASSPPATLNKMASSPMATLNKTSSSTLNKTATTTAASLSRVPASPGVEVTVPRSGSEWEPAWSEGGEKLVWETHTVTLGKVPNLGFGIAVSGGRDNPHFANGDPSIAVSDVLKAGPAEGRLLINDRILSVNGIPLDNVDHATAISVLTDSGNSVTLVIRRKVILPPADEFEVPYKVTLSKKNKKEDYGVVLGYRLFVKEIIANSLAAQEGDLKEGDTILKINNQPIEALSLYEAKKQIEKSKEKLQLVIKSSHRPKSLGPAPTSRTPDPDKGHKSDNKPDNRYGSNNLRPISFAQLDRPASPLLSSGQREGQGTDEGPPRPPLPNHLDNGDGPPRPPSPSAQDYQKKPSDFSGPYGGGEPFYEAADTNSLRRRAREPGSDPRFISFKKVGHGSVGICISGGNRSGIYVHKVAPNTPAEQQGLHEGDMIMKVNDVDLRGKTREEALLMLTSLREQVNLLVVYRREEYDALMSSGGSGDYFHIRTHFTYIDTEHGEMSFRPYDVFRVTNTLHNGIVGSWEVVKLSSHNNRDAKKGIIPNRNRAEQLCLANCPDKENVPASSSKQPRGGGSFFKKKVARRAKSLGKDHWDDIIFGGAGGTQRTGRTANPSSKFPVYERVVLRDTGFVRPVVVLGPLADVAIDKLIREKNERYQSPQTDLRDDETKGRSTIIRFGAIREIRDRGKHAVLDVTPSAVDRLTYNQFAPVVLFLRPESKQAVKELRQKWAKSSKKSYRKLYEHAVKLEKNFSYLFTHTVALTNGLAWYRKLQEAIDISQKSPVWMSEIQMPEESVKDDYLFPMGHRLSYASSPESDLDLRSHGLYDDDDPMIPDRRGPRMVRSSSDPSINTAENIPGIPPYPAPPGYRGSRNDFGPPHDRMPHQSGHYDRVPHRHRAPHDPDRAPHRGPHPEDRYYPYFYGDAPRGGDKYAHSRANIDPYATLTPSERLRGQTDPGYRSDGGRSHRKPAIDRDRRRSALDQLQWGSPQQQHGPANHGPPNHGPPNHGPANHGPTNHGPANHGPANHGPPNHGPPSHGPANYGPPNHVSYGSPQHGPPDTSVYSYRVEQHRPNEMGREHNFHEPEYQKYASHPANRHDDSKLQEKFGDLPAAPAPGADKAGPNNAPGGVYGPGGNTYGPGGPPPSGDQRRDHDPYRYSRSTLHPYSRHEDPYSLKPRTASVNSPPQPSSDPRDTQRDPHRDPRDPPTRAKSETNVYQEGFQPPPSNIPVTGAPTPYYKSQPNLDRTPPDGEKPRELRPYEPLNRQRLQNTSSLQNPAVINGSPSSRNHGNDSDADKGYESRPESTYERPTKHRPNTAENTPPTKPQRSNTDADRNKGDILAHHRPTLTSKSYKQPEGSQSGVNGDSARMRSYSNQLYMDSTEMQQNTSKDTYSSRDSGLPNSLERPSTTPTKSLSFESYMKLVTPGFYGSKKTSTPITTPVKSKQSEPAETDQSQTPEREPTGPDGKPYNSAFESYRKPSPNTSAPPQGPATPQGTPAKSNGPDLSNREPAVEDTHTVVATARGVFDSNGGILESAETGVSIVIPKGALPEHQQQEIYFKVCQDNSILPPLDKDKGETLLSPLVMCGPHGLKFLQPVELKLPHCASVNPDSWSFALKSSGAPDDKSSPPAQWQNMTLAGIDGVSQGKVGKKSVSVLVDHF